MNRFLATLAGIVLYGLAFCPAYAGVGATHVVCDSGCQGGIITVAPAANALNGHGSATDTTTTSLHAAVTSKSIYVTGWACSNSGATAVTVTFQDGSGGAQIGSPIEVAAGSGNNMPAGALPWFNTSSATALFFAASGSTSTLYCEFTGFSQ